MSLLSQQDFACITSRHEELSNQLLAGSVDSFARPKIQRELSQLSALIDLHKQLDDIHKQQEQIKEDLNHEQDADFKILLQEELHELEQQHIKITNTLEDTLFPADPIDDRECFLEIRAGTGGQEAALFASELIRMYMAYALKKGWRTSVVSISETDLKGVREAVLHIQGKQAYGHLKFESGVHRVQRVPQTETAGRVHTSTVTIAVLPEAEEVDISINTADLRIDVYRSSGAGGQHVNTTDSAVRITHIPTGVVVTCQDERSQHKNKAKALKVLKSRLFIAQQEKVDQERSLQRKEQVGTGMRSEKVRTYNFPQNRVTDHQAEITLQKLDMVMDGALDEIIDAVILYGKKLRRAGQTVSWCQKS